MSRLAWTRLLQYFFECSLCSFCFKTQVFSKESLQASISLHMMLAKCKENQQRAFELLFESCPHLHHDYSDATIVYVNLRCFHILLSSSLTYIGGQNNSEPSCAEKNTCDCVDGCAPFVCLNTNITTILLP